MYLKLKYFFDILFSFLLIILLLPVFILIALAIRVDTKGGALFKQKRLGYHEKEFILFKFRTMYELNTREIVQVYEDSPEITRVGSFLRRYKLDELPQLFNVFIGQMSIIGPRPIVPMIKKEYDRNTLARFNVKPGLTSLAAIKGSIYLTWEQKWYYDKKYAENVNLCSDLHIVYGTIILLIVGEKKLAKKNIQGGDKKI
jgi:lipopolysaccharide/colanic/teichoic acid biosynthesis glycosyltransferase